MAESDFDRYLTGNRSQPIAHGPFGNRGRWVGVIVLLPDAHAVIVALAVQCEHRVAFRLAHPLGVVVFVDGYQTVYLTFRRTAIREMEFL